MSVRSLRTSICILNIDIFLRIYFRLALAVEQMTLTLANHSKQLNDITNRLERIQYAPHLRNGSISSQEPFGGGVSLSTVVKSLFYALIGLTVSVILRWLFK